MDVVCGMWQQLGSDQLLFEPSGSGSGHVTRNVRLALSLIDLVQVGRQQETTTTMTRRSSS